MTPSAARTVSPLQYACLETLYDGKKTGKQMRATLSGRGVRKNPIAFYHTIRWLKDAALIASSRSVTQPFGYLGPAFVYELTAAGRYAVLVTRALNDTQVSAAEAYRVPASKHRATKPSNNYPIREAS